MRNKVKSASKASKRGPVPMSKRQTNQFDRLSDDLLVLIFTAVAATATSTADLLNVALTSKKFQWAGCQRPVLKNASPAALSVRADSWSRGAHVFLWHCAEMGNTDASYILGTICYYCLGKREDGIALMLRAANQHNSAALHTLSIIAFNGSVYNDACFSREKNLSLGIALCIQASSFGNIDAMRELGHCLIDGYGIRTNRDEGLRLLKKASAQARAEAGYLSTISGTNAENALSYLKFNGSVVQWYRHRIENNVSRRRTRRRPRRLTSPKLHPSNQVLVDWFKRRSLHPLLRLCSNDVCGRPETRPNEFRECTKCREVQYCSKVCQALDWYFGHKRKCDQPEWEGRPDQYEIDEDFGPDEEGNDGDDGEYRFVVLD